MTTTWTENVAIVAAFGLAGGLRALVSAYLDRKLVSGVIPPLEKEPK